MSVTTKLTAAALAGLMTAGLMTATAAFAAEEAKASCTGKDKAAAEKCACKGADGKPSECHKKDAAAPAAAPAEKK